MDLCGRLNFDPAIRETDYQVGIKQSFLRFVVGVALKCGRQGQMALLLMYSQQMKSVG